VLGLDTLMAFGFFLVLLRLEACALSFVLFISFTLLGLTLRCAGHRYR
jgi:hypothetical protein